MNSRVSRSATAVLDEYRMKLLEKLLIKLEEDDIYEDEANSVDIEFIFSESVSEEIEKLGIDAELSLSILSGLVKIKGSASYLHDQKASAKSVRMTMAYTVRTKSQEIDSIRGKIDKKLLESDEATHVVVGIEWGAKCNITCEYENTENEEITTVKGELEAEIEKLKNMISAKGGTNLDLAKKGMSAGTKFEYHSKCDVSDLSEEIPSSFEAAVKSVINLPSIIKKTNAGKGVPISFALISLQKLRKMCKLESDACAVYKQVEESYIKKCFQVIEQVSNTRQQLYDLISNFKAHADAISMECIEEAHRLKNNFDISESEFKSTLMKILVDIRTGKCDPSIINDALSDFLSSSHSPAVIGKNISKFEDQVGKIHLIKQLVKRNAHYFGAESTYELALQQNSSNKVYLLYLNYSSKRKFPENWKKQTDLFFRLMCTGKEDPNHRFVIFDVEMQPESSLRDQMYIEYYDKGVLCCEDVYQEEGKHLENCIIKMNNLEPLRRKPNKRVIAEIRCPKSFQRGCSIEATQWTCKVCLGLIDYGIDDGYFYCKCGGAKHSDVEFKCNDTKHGLQYVAYEQVLFREVLSKLRMTKEINILILGETGVGKSTWINALANYLAFQTLNDAKESDDIKVLIPTQFSYTSETGKSQCISVGSKSLNEVLVTGQSATQGPKAYRFFVGKHVISLIDTPGIGDVRGLEQDEKNFESILAHLSYYDEIHGICILLKPNDSRLTVTFRFCITELLTHLHKSAAENIIFCFTNARSTFYRPGDTLPTLKQLVSEYKDANLTVSPQNQFCFDNEAFRFLACLINGIHFNQQDIATYSSSWDRAVVETKRLFEHILELKPHSVRHTVSLNNARRIILELSKPLAKVAANIQVNIDSANNKAKELEASKKKASELQDKLYLDAVDLEVVHLDYPRTVCTDLTCVQYVQVMNETSRTVYKQQCHAHCYLSGIPTECTNNADLQTVWR
eukprot:gene1186-biopygen413